MSYRMRCPSGHSWVAPATALGTWSQCPQCRIMVLVQPPTPLAPPPPPPPPPVATVPPVPSVPPVSRPSPLPPQRPRYPWVLLGLGAGVAAAGVLAGIGLIVWFVATAILRPRDVAAPAPAAVVSVPATAPRPPADTAGAIRLADLSLGAATLDQGRDALVNYEVRNTSAAPVQTPLRDGEYALGRRIHALERLGDVKRIKALERQCDQVDSRYVIASPLLRMDPTIAPGQSTRFSFLIPTDGLEPGRYRCWVSLRPAGREGANMELSADFEVLGADPVPAAATPTPAPATMATLPPTTAPVPSTGPVSPPPTPTVVVTPLPTRPPVRAIPPAGLTASDPAPDAEIDKAWWEAQLNTLNQAAKKRDREILAAMRSRVEELLLAEPAKRDPAKTPEPATPANPLRAIRGPDMYASGYTAINTYALLHAGHAISDPRLQHASKELGGALDELLALDTTATYVASLQANALAMLPDKRESRDPLRRVQQHLLVKTDGGYSYTLQPATPRPQFTPAGPAGFRPVFRDPFDNSNTQYANLGVWATADAGLEVPTIYWASADAHWRSCQSTDGGWDYTNGGPTSTFTMTCAGLASLLTVSSSQRSDHSPYRDPVITKGLTALDRHLGAGRGGFASAWGGGYGLYGLERVGLASGLKRFGDHDWYADGCATVVPPAAGLAFPARARFARAASSPEPAYELLFLTRGRNPIALNKLRYDGPWDAHPWDDANITHWLSKKFERPLNWQIVDASASVSDWMDAPILLITGEHAFNTDDAFVAKLQAYLDAGGTVLSTAEHGSSEFTAFIRKLANRACRGRYEMRELPDDHTIFNLHYHIAKGTKLWGLTNGSRELWIHSPMDFSNDWQRYAVANTASFEIPANIVLYASGKMMPRNRLLLTDPHTVTPAPTGREITVARLEYSGNWEPEPGTWPLLSLWAGDAGLKVTTPSTDADHLRELKPQVLYMTGTARFVATDNLRTALTAYISGGGLLLADAAGGRPEFMTSFEDLLRQLFPKLTAEQIPPDDPLYASAGLAEITAKRPLFRRSWILANGNSTTPRLWGVKSGPRWVVVFSHEDLASGFLGTDTWGIPGYTPAASRQLTASILRYALTAPPEH